MNTRKLGRYIADWLPVVLYGLLIWNIAADEGVTDNGAISLFVFRVFVFFIIIALFEMMWRVRRHE